MADVCEPLCAASEDVAFADIWFVEPHVKGGHEYAQLDISSLLCADLVPQSGPVTKIGESLDQRG